MPTRIVACGLLLLFAALFFPFQKLRGARNIDSLVTLMNTAPTDSGKIDAQIQLAFALADVGNDTMFTVAKAAFDRAVNQRSLVLQGRALNVMGHAKRQLSLYPEALHYLNQAVAIGEQTGERGVISSALKEIGIVYTKQNKLAEAYTTLKSALDTALAAGDSITASDILLSIGNISYLQSNINDALKLFREALAMAEMTRDQRQIARALNNVAGMHYMKGELDTAVIHYERMRQLYEDVGETAGAFSALTNMGAVNYRLGDKEAALNSHQQALQIARELNDNARIIRAMNNIGTTYLSMEDSESAKRFCREAYEKALALATFYEKKYTCDCLYEIYKFEKDFEKALEYYQLREIAKDSLLSQDNLVKITQVESRHQFEFEQRELEAEKAEAERKKKEATGRRDNLQYTGIVIFLMLLFLGLFGLSRVQLSQRTVEGIVFFSFLLVFEFILVLLDPWVGELFDEAPLILLIFNFAVAAMITPVHLWLEKRVKAYFGKQEGKSGNESGKTEVDGK